MDHRHSQTDPLPANRVEPPAAESTWTRHYAAKHRWQRLTDFPPGLQVPAKVRIYSRCQHFILQWWDPAAKKNLAERVDGDWLAALVRARQVDDRLKHFRSGGPASVRKLSHADLVAAFLADARQRADAGDIDPATVERYHSALDHYLAFCEQPGLGKSAADPAQADRAFRLALAAYLAQRRVSPNGRTQALARPMKGQRFVLDTVRALYAWAADPLRGRLLPEGFHNPFLRRAGERGLLKTDPLAEPDITPAMAVDLILACDRFQLRLFVPMLLFGLRAAEPCFLFAEYLENGWLRVPCNGELGYFTKGRREKRFPLLEDLSGFWSLFLAGQTHGLLYRCRAVSEGKKIPLSGASLAELVAEFCRRCHQEPTLTAAAKRQIRDRLFGDAGAIRYDQIQGEFAKLAGVLHWPAQATLKDLRHLFATTMNNAALPEAYRGYLMGHSPGKAALTAYTHLNELRRHYTEAVRREWTSLLAAIERRAGEVGGTDVLR